MTQTNEDYRHRLAELLSSAGVGYSQVSLEVLYMLPREFLEKYVELWYMALGPTVKSSMSGNQRDGDLGKAKNDTRSKGVVPGAGAGGGGKRTRGAFSIADEIAFQLKDRIDKRLRGIARELRLALADIEARKNTPYRTNTAEKTNTPERTASKTNTPERTCPKCGRFGATGWGFCPIDGSHLIQKM